MEHDETHDDEAATCADGVAGVADDNAAGDGDGNGIGGVNGPQPVDSGILPGSVRVADGGGRRREVLY